MIILLDLEVNGYTAEQVRRVLHMATGSRRVSFRYALIGEHDAPKNNNLYVYPGGSLSGDAGGNIARSARLELRDDNEIDWQNDRIQIFYRLQMPDGGMAEWPLAVLYMPTAPVRRMGNSFIRSVECYDGIMALTNDAVTERLFYPAGTRQTDAVAQLIASAGITSIMIDDSAEVMRTDHEYEPYTPKWDIIDDLLREINYTSLRVDGRGVFRSGRYTPDIERLPDYVYAADQLSVIRPGSSLRMDVFSIPNVFVGLVSNPEAEDMSYTYINDNPASPISVPSRRGRRVVQRLDFDDIASMNALQQATIRAADEASRAFEAAEFETALMPHHEIDDCLQIDHPLISGRFVERTWNMTLKAGGTMRHTAERLVTV